MEELRHHERTVPLGARGFQKLVLPYLYALLRAARGNGVLQSAMPAPSHKALSSVADICIMGAMRPVALAIFLIMGCTNRPLNDPYPNRDKKEMTFYGAFSERPKHLDPAQSYSSNEIVFTAQIYEPLFQYHYLKRPYTLIPLTATALPTPIPLDPHGKPLPAEAPDTAIAMSLYEVKIMPSILYQPHPAFAKGKDGSYLYHALTEKQLRLMDRLSDFKETASRELTAEDYIYQIKRLAHPKIHSPIYGFMSEYIVGLKELRQRLQEAPLHEGQFLDLRPFPLAGAEVVDRYTYRIKIYGKYPQFIYWLAMPFFAPLPWEADRFYSQNGLMEKNITLDWHPVGTGPYMLTINDPNRKMVLVKNPNFRHERYPEEGEPTDGPNGLLRDRGRLLPFVEKAIYSLEKEEVPAWNKFLQGYYDASGIASDNFDQAIQMGEAGRVALTDTLKQQGIQLRITPSPTTYYIGVNMLDPVIGGFSESARLLRRALSIAIDQEEAIAIFQNGRGIVMQGPLPPGIFGYREAGLRSHGINRFTHIVNGQPKRRTIEEARRWLAKAGYPEGREARSGKPLLLYFDTAGGGPDDKAHFDWLRKQFEKLSIQLVIRNTTYNRFQDKMLKGDAQIFQWGWHADYPDPENFLFLLYGPNAKAKGGGENATNYSNMEFDRIFEQMRHMANGPARQRLIDQMVEIVRRDAPWISGFHPKSFGLYHAWYGNLKPNAIAYNTLKYVTIHSALREEKQGQWNRPVVWPLLVFVALLGSGILPAIRMHRKRERKAAW